MKNTFYLDMDGVCADWDAGAVRALGISRKLEPINGQYTITRAEWDRLRQVPDFYRNLPVMQGSEELVFLARQYRDLLNWNLYFLTAIPHKNDVPEAFADKVLWGQQHYPDIPVRFGPYSSDKWRHCRPGDILVDDRHSNCDDWRGAGGQAWQVVNRDLGSTTAQVREDLRRRVSLKNLRDLSLDLI